MNINPVSFSEQVRLCKQLVLQHLFAKFNQKHPDYRGIKELRLLLDALNAIPSD